MIQNLPPQPIRNMDRSRRAVADGCSEGGYCIEEPRATLAVIWVAIFKIYRLRVLADFFGMRSHVLLAALAAARIQKELSIDLLPRFSFEAWPAEQLAQDLPGRMSRIAVLDRKSIG